MIFFSSYYMFYSMLGFILIPGILLSMYAEIRVQSTFNKYNRMISTDGRTASEIARMFLDLAGLHDIKVVHVRGHLSDHYNHRTKTLALSDSVYNSNTIAAIGVACHEVGHALQYKQSYFPIKLRNVFIPLCNFGNKILWILILIGLISFANIGGILLDIAVIIFAFSTLLNLVTLPVEFNASKRAVKILGSTNTLSTEECEGVKSVLNSAALTYVAAFIVSFLSLLRLIIILGIHKKDD